MKRVNIVVSNPGIAEPCIFELTLPNGTRRASVRVDRARLQN
jgi:hypothetical protein